jgi:hypothetical protein
MESVETLNKRLIEYWGYGNGDSPNFRIVFSDDQLEKQYGTRSRFTSNGIFLGTDTEVAEVPKYSWIIGKYLLEQLQEVPLINKRELLDRKLSYEPRWTFEDKFGNPLPPKWEVCELVILSIMKNRGPKHFAKYTEGDPVQERLERVMKIEDELYGNESNLGDALAHKEAVVLNNRDMELPRVDKSTR